MVTTSTRLRPRRRPHIALPRVGERYRIESKNGNATVDILDVGQNDVRVRIHDGKLCFYTWEEYVPSTMTFTAGEECYINRPTTKFYGVA